MIEVTRRRFVQVAAATAAWAAIPVRALEEVPYVQTPQPVVDALLQMARIGPRDFLIDLGSGDGRIVLTAAKRYGTPGLGVDYDHWLVAKATANAKAQGLDRLVRFEQQNVFETDLRRATAVAIYMLPDTNLALRPRLLEMLRPGSRIVAHDYDMGDWRPDEKRVIPAPNKPVGVRKESDVFLWIVPARLAGRWDGRLGAEKNGRAIAMDVAQTFQDVTLTATVDGREATVGAAKLVGARLSVDLTVGAERYAAVLTARGDELVGEAKRAGHAGAGVPLRLSRRAG